MKDYLTDDLRDYALTTHDPLYADVFERAANRIEMLEREVRRLNSAMRHMRAKGGIRPTFERPIPPIDQGEAQP